MPLTQIAKARWQSCFDRVSRGLGGKEVQVEVTGLGLLAQLQAEWVPLIGISYDPHGDVLMVALEGIEHEIRHPREIHVDGDGETLHSVEAVDAEGERHILLLRNPLSLPPPSS